MTSQQRLWYQPVAIDDVRGLIAGNMLEHVGIEFTDLGRDYLRGTMPVDGRTMQPFGILHGGASVVLAETLGSVAANLCVDPGRHMCVGLDLTSNHIRQVTGGTVTGTARAVHVGGRTQVWEITIENEAGQLVNTTRLTMLVLDRPQRRNGEGTS